METFVGQFKNTIKNKEPLLLIEFFETLHFKIWKSVCLRVSQMNMFKIDGDIFISLIIEYLSILNYRNKNCISIFSI